MFHFNSIIIIVIIIITIIIIILWRRCDGVGEGMAGADAITAPE